MHTAVHPYIEKLSQCKVWPPCPSESDTFFSTKNSPVSTICLGGWPSSMVPHQMMESSYGSGTPTILSCSDDVTSTGLSSVPQGASSLYCGHLCDDPLRCALCLQCTVHLASANVLPGLLKHVLAFCSCLQLLPVSMEKPVMEIAACHTMQ